MQSRDFGWVVMAIRIQREVGGNLAELLLTVAATLREREYLRRHVHALSAEGRLSCYVLGGLPPGFLAYLTLSKPDYVEPMFSTPIGWLMCRRHGRPAGGGHLLDVQGLEGGRVMNLILPVGFGLIFVALFMVFAAVGGLTKERTGVNRSIAVLEALTAAPAEMKVELEPNFSDRVLFPLLARTQAMGRRLTPEDASDRIREKLDLAGNPNGWTVERVMAGKVVGFGAGLMVSLVHRTAHASGLPAHPRLRRARLAGGLPRPEHVPLPAGLRPVREAAAGAARRDRPAHHLGGVRPRVRRGLCPGVQEHRRPAGRRVRPHAAGDADRSRTVRRPALTGGAHQPPGPALLRQRDGPGGRLRHPGRAGAPGPVLRDPGQAAPVGRGAWRRRCRSRSWSR